MCTHIKSATQHTAVANHRTKGGSSQQVVPLISHRKQQAATTLSFVATGRSCSWDTSRAHQQSSVCVWYQTWAVTPACCSTPLKTTFFFFFFLIGQTSVNIFRKVTDRRRKGISVTSLETETHLLYGLNAVCFIKPLLPVRFDMSTVAE